MKQPLKVKHWMAISLALVFIGSCTDDDFGPDRWKRQKTTDTGRFTVDEAKLAFERHYTVVCHSRSEAHHGADEVPDDDFTPLWDTAVCRDRDSSSFMTVPIATHKLIRIADIRNGKKNPQRLAVVKEELHIVKNHAMNMVVPTMKTIIPLDGSDLTTKGSSPKNALYIYRLLNGEVLNYQLFRDGREVFHTYPGEAPASYHAKMEEIDRELEGLSLIESEVFTFSGANEIDITICGYCGGAHPITTICDLVVTNCAKCGARIPSSGYHNCPLQRSTCAICYASYITSQGHTCPKPNYCNTCGQSFTNSHTCPGPTPKHCNLCNQSYIGNHNCPGLGKICGKCNQYYIGSHNCQGTPKKICTSCGQIYSGSVHTNCPNFCAICGTTPCNNKCSSCGTAHCTFVHTPVLTGDPKLKKSIEDILKALGGTPLVTIFQHYLDQRQISFTPKSGQLNVIIGEIFSFTNGTLGFKFIFDPDKINKATEFSLYTISLHELYHIYSTDKNGLVSNPNNPLANNDRDHYNMINDPNYVIWLKKIFPGHTEDFYNKLKYSGTMGSPVFENLSEKEQRKLKKFFEKNQLKNQ